MNEWTIQRDIDDIKAIWKKPGGENGMHKFRGLRSYKKGYRLEQIYK